VELPSPATTRLTTICWAMFLLHAAYDRYHGAANPSQSGFSR
jgi:hypothetical protein